MPWLEDMRVPLLMLVAGADFMTPVTEFDSFAAELDEAGVEHQMTVYEDAPHGFFDAASEGHEAACDDAWRRLLGFMDREAA